MPSDSILVPPGIANHTYQNPFEYHVYWGAVTNETGLFQRIEALRLLGFKDSQIALSINAGKPDGSSAFINEYFQLNKAGKMDKWQVLEQLASKFPPRAESYPPSPTNAQLQAQLAAPRRSVSVVVTRNFNSAGGSNSSRGATILAFRRPEDGTVPQSSSGPVGQPSSPEGSASSQPSPLPSSLGNSASSQLSPSSPASSQEGSTSSQPSAASLPGNSASSQSSSGRSIPFYRDAPPSHSENGWVTDAGRLHCAEHAFKRVFFSRQNDLEQIPGYRTAESPAAKEEALFAEATRRGQGPRFESAREGLLASLRRADPSRLSYLPRGLATWCRQSRPAIYLDLLGKKASLADPAQIARYAGGTAAALGGFGVLVGVTQLGFAINEMLIAEESSYAYPKESQSQFNSAAADAVRAGGRTAVSAGIIVRGVRIIKAVTTPLSVGGAIVAAPVLAVTEVAAGVIEGKGKQGPEKAAHVKDVTQKAAAGYVAGATWAPAGAVGGAKLGALIGTAIAPGVGTAVGTVVGALIGSGVAFLAGTALGNAAMAYSGRGKTDEQVNKSMPLARFINWAIG